MLNYSFSTIWMAIAASNLLIILLTICFRNTKIMINAGYKLLALFIIFTLARFLIPFELPFTISFYWSDSVSESIWLLFTPWTTIFNRPVTVWIIIKWIWKIGIFINLFLYLLSYIRTRNYIILHAKVISQKEPYAQLINRICQEQNKRNRFNIIELPGIESPFLFGIIKPCIMIPEHFSVPENDLYYVLQHEASHHFHHDLVMKTFIKFVNIIYWWNPFCYKLYKQADVILEMRIDDSITLDSYESTKHYLQCLCSVSEQINKKRFVSKNFTMSLLPKEVSDINKRFGMLVFKHREKKKSLNALLCLTALIIYVLSYMFVIEAFHRPQEQTYLTPTGYSNKLHRPYEPESNAYAIQNDDGTYDIYCDYEYIDTVTSLRYYADDIPIYTKENCPY